ncbi:uncharacterized protein YjiS (DUF1127 family) [Pacificibacter maritimus]|uniref:Uncharacterized protein YjiS (DUF1127 family) n=1 Tax=Pacificibacter maritimus TaxID=762213 RepID=A0A3N4V4M7_9RHOB|nr:DUF1127 domain-containing protein [Pacificibacter maritimus]RPE72067.1 uncharacterized protein YjiS (DUF1127 family) [Pacificibacter maritimus]
MASLTLRRAFGAPSSTSLLSRLAQARTVARQRKALAALDDHILDDIGVTRAQAEHESSRPAWDAPNHWKA